MTQEKNIDNVAVLESVLFMYGREITVDNIAKLLDITKKEVVDLVEQLQEEYNNRQHCGMKILVHDNKLQMVTSSEASTVIEQITKKELEGELTQVAMEVLSIIAYRGPITKQDIEAIRGVNCSFTLRNLVRRGLIERVQQEKNKVYKYQITIDLLRILGVDNVEQLPEYDELSQDKRIDAILRSDSIDGE